jgi:2C-methyl-D-erythritol 2,4-cyclodiphosphate synthase
MAYGKVCAEGYELMTADCILIAEQRRIASRRHDMRVRRSASKRTGSPSAPR